MDGVDGDATQTVTGAGQGCLFCGIVAGSVPGDIAATNDLAVAFADIHPAAPLHVLVVPRSHIDDAAGVRSAHGATLAAMFCLANEVATAGGVAESGYRLLLNVGEDSGNTIGHLHMHVLGGRKLGPLP